MPSEKELLGQTGLGSQLPGQGGLPASGAAGDHNAVHGDRCALPIACAGLISRGPLWVALSI
jgi:hypothetical protein